MDTVNQLRADASAIFAHALQACDVPAAFDRHLRFEGETLIWRPSPQGEPVAFPLDKFKTILIIALGKAALTMTSALLDRLPRIITVHGICSAPEVPSKDSEKIRYYAGGHPVPNEESFQAARQALKLLSYADKDTFVFFLVSGGGSAMFELPHDSRISLDDTVAFYRCLVGSGATITEINTVRKFFSAVKGGRLALAAPSAEKLSLLIADVPLKNVGVVASSPTLLDRSTPQQCRQILDRFHLLDQIPRAVSEYFDNLNLDLSSRQEETESIGHTHFDVLLSDHDLVNAARDHAHSLGYHVIIDNTCDDWDYRDASQYLLKRFHELRREFPRLCVLSSGEVTVTLEGPSGCGGRNQQFVLATAFELEQDRADAVVVLSAGSDGIDGNSPAAGSIADPTSISRARASGLDPEAALAHFDSCTLFTALGDSIVTGPTGNNLRDLRILLASQET